MRIVLLGPPGSGKGELSQQISNHYGIPIITVSSVMQRAAAEQSELGRLAKEAMDMSRVSDELLLALLRIQLPQMDLSKGFVLVDLPKNAGQADVLDSVLSDLGAPVELVLDLQVDRDELMERLVGRITCDNCGAQYNLYVNPPLVDGVCDACGARVVRRPDDYEETISNRLRVYEGQMGPLLQYYQLNGKLHRIEADEGVPKVWKAVHTLIDAIPPSPPPGAVAVEAEAPPKPAKKSVRPKPAARAAKKPAAATPAAAEKKAPARQAAVSKAPDKAAAEAAVKKAAKKGAAEKPAAKKAAAKKAAPKPAATKKAAAEKAVVKKPVAKKAAPKKAPAKKAAPKKAAPKKAAPKKAVPKKPVAKKAPAKKPAVKKAPIKKAAPKKAAAKRPAANKPVAKKTAPKKAATKTKKTPAKKVPAKKAPVKKAPAKKAVPKRPVAKAAAAKKTAVKKGAAGKAPAKKAMVKGGKKTGRR